MGKDVERQKTTYVVLVQKSEAVDGGDDSEPAAESWDYVGTVEAETGARAMRHFSETNEQEGVFVAVPQRSWVPSRLTLERTPRAVVSELRGA